jgi:LacI family transcriptional regulator
MSQPKSSPASDTEIPDIRSVAARAGVSTSTVSRCLTGKRKLAADVEQRILEAVRELGYAPNRIARSLRVKRTNSFGMVIPDNSNPYFSDVVKGAEDAARAAGFVLLMFNSGEDRDRELDHLSTMQAFRCDGALLITAPEHPDPHQEQVRRTRLQRYAFPIVYLGRDPGFETDLVLADSFSASREAVSHLVQQGHRRVAVISVGPQTSSQRDRVAGYRQALGEAGIQPPEAYVQSVPLTVDNGFEAATRLLALPEPPTAIFATSNALTIGTVAAIEARGLRCPDDVSVVGYDSYPWQDVFHPRLSTVKQPAYQIGHRAAQLLIQRLNGERTEPERITLRSTLVTRESSAPPRDRG